MKIKEINEEAEQQLAQAFGQVLTDNGIGYKTVGVYEKEGNFTAFIEMPDGQVSVMEWEAKRSLGYEAKVIAMDILTPFIKRREQLEKEKLN